MIYGALVDRPDGLRCSKRFNVLVLTRDFEQDGAVQSDGKRER